MRKKIILGITLLIVICALFGLYFYFRAKGQLQMFSSVEAFRTWVSTFGLAAPVVFGLVQALSVVIAPIPNNIITLAGGAMFGAWGSILISSVAIIIGSCIAFALSRGFGKPLVCRLVDKKIIQKYEGISSSKQDMFLVLSLLLPFFPDDAICFMAGLSKIRFLRFLLITLFTRPWGLIVASLLGSGDARVPLWGWALMILATAAVFVFGIKYGSKVEDAFIKKYKRAEPVTKKIEPDMENAEPIMENREPDMENAGPIMENKEPAVENARPILEKAEKAK